MHKRSPDELSQLIEQRLPPEARGGVLIAFSGGLDSSVLLRALATQRTRRHVRAIHINHGLHPHAHSWEAHCAEQARALGIEFEAQAVVVPANSPEGIESAARRVRYAALRQSLRSHETLLTAHHADDQLETVLLALMRGSGVDGLAAMPVCQRFGCGWHLRPLLEFTRAELCAWASERELLWLDDPSNDSTRFDRNYLRSAVVPALRARWPSAAHTASRAALHLGEASALLDELAAQDFAGASTASCLSVAALQALPAPRRRNVLRYWLRACGARAPSTRKLSALDHDMLAAQEDRLPCVEWDGIEVRRHRGFLYCMQQLSPAPLELSWDWRQPLRLRSGFGEIRAEIAHGAGIALSKLPPRLRVMNRRGGERIRLPGRQHRHEIKKLLQEINVLPWLRERLPLLYDGAALVAVADLWIDARYAAQPNEPSVHIRWDLRPQLQGIDEPEA